MKKLLALSGAFVLIASAANAQISVSIGEPAYVAPTYVETAPDWPSAHYDVHTHRHHDYWARAKHDDRRDVRERR